MTSAQKKSQSQKKSAMIDEMKEEPIPFLVYNSNTRSNLLYSFKTYNNFLFYRIYPNFPRRRCNKVIQRRFWCNICGWDVPYRKIISHK